VDGTGGATRYAQVDRPRAPLVDPRKLVLRSGEPICAGHRTSEKIMFSEAETVPTSENMHG
jgi:hypothetical protein